MVEHIAQIARRIPGMAHRVGGKQRQIFTEGEQAALLLEFLLHQERDALQILQNALGHAPENTMNWHARGKARAARYFASISRASSRFSIMHLSSVHTENESCPDTVCLPALSGVKATGT